ncbi:MAG: Crp/Fnr family transcriptional regulator [Mailhella sp.]|nr:Crp/Fnr family transcriptional regulator [Mailhella sp.]MBQ3171067.1 Crp/Fnr family transcriptional regulator [Mailhella sp.]
MGQTARITDIPYWTSQEQNVQEKLASLFPELTVQECARLASSSRVVAYAKNEWIFSEGESLGSADWLLSGNVELLKGSMAGKNTILHVVREDHFLDHCIFFGSGQAFVSALALSKCSILRIDAKVLRSVLMGNAAFAMRLMKALAIRQRMFINKIAVSQGKISVRRRVAGWLLHKARVGRTNVVDDGITREVLAGLLGLSRESLSRQLSSFAEDGLVRLEKKAIIIEDEKALRRFLED